MADSALIGGLKHYSLRMKGVFSHFGARKAPEPRVAGRREAEGANHQPNQPIPSLTLRMDGDVQQGRGQLTDLLRTPRISRHIGLCSCSHDCKLSCLLIVDRASFITLRHIIHARLSTFLPLTD